MKVTKQMLHEDLQPTFTFWRVIGLLPTKFMAKLQNALLGIFTKGKNIESLQCDEQFILSSDGEWDIRVRVYRPMNHRPLNHDSDSGEKLPVMLYCHGGGYIMGNPESHGDIIKTFIETRPCVVVAPDYRKAYTKPFPAGFNDCYETLLWAKDNAEQLGIDATKVMVAGHSAGGGLTAAVTLKARDTKDVDIAFQMPIYPMIDDLQPFDPARDIHSPVWSTKMNKIGWGAYLADLHEKGEEIPAYAAPARNTDYRGFPPTITFVGSMEPFYWETLHYVEALEKGHVEVSFKQFDGCYHAFEVLARNAEISKDAWNFTYDEYAKFYDKHVITRKSPEAIAEALAV
jgi:acetyl esterase/lipase